MSDEDRFDDLGSGEPKGKSAAERFAELDEREAAEAAEKKGGGDADPRARAAVTCGSSASRSSS